MIKIRVSIVDPERRKRENLADKISRQASGVQCFQQFADADEAMREMKADLPDVLLLDLDKPGLGTIESVASIKAAHPSMIVLVTISNEDNPEVLEALRKGACGCLMNTASSSETVLAITHAYHGGSPMPLSVGQRMLPLLHRKKAPAPQVLTLTPKEEKIIKLLAGGLHYKEIAASLVVSPSTVRAHLHTIYNKLNVESRTGAVAKYFGGQLAAISAVN